jgi:hypothetical protein
MQRLSTPQAVNSRSQFKGFWFALIVIGTAIPVVGPGSVTGLLGIFVLLLGAILVLALRIPMLRNLWTVAIVWSTGQALSNIAHGQYYVTFLIYAGITIALLASGLYWIHETVQLSATSIAIAFGVGWALLKISTGVLSSVNPWKYGLSIPIAIIVIAFAYHRRASRKFIALLFVGLAITSRYFDNRFQTALFVLAAIAVLSITSDRSRQKRRVKGTLLALAAAGAVIYIAYPSAADEGLLGERAMIQQQRDDQNDANFLLSIRKELPMTYYLAAQNPVLGIGSYSKITSSESAAAIGFVEKFTGPIDASERVYITGGLGDRAGYKAHSEAASGLLYAGVLAAPFWIWLLVQIGKALLTIVRGKAIMPGLMFYMTGLVTWDLLFSPLDGNTHLIVGFFLFIVAASAKKADAVEEDNSLSSSISPGQVIRQ